MNFAEFYQNSDKKCQYDFDMFGSFGLSLKKMTRTPHILTLFLVLNWIHFLIIVIMLSIIVYLLKNTLKNFYGRTTSYEVHLRKYANTDSLIKRELKSNF